MANRIEIGSSNTILKLDDVLKDIRNYWKSTPEMTFPIDCRMLRSILTQSPTGHVALKIDNITTPTSILAYWVAYDNSNPPADSSFYRVLDAALVNSLCTDVTPIFNGKQIDGRIALKRTTSDNYYVFFHKGNIARKGGGGGGTVEGAGVTVR